jgi:hypothetical protein
MQSVLGIVSDGPSRTAIFGIVIFCEKGPETIRQLFTGLQRVVNHYSDTVFVSYITKIIPDRKTQVAQIIEDAIHD